jgi:hypothetical protein
MLMTYRLNHLARDDTIKLPSIVWTSSKGAIVHDFKGDEMANAFFLDTFLS